MTNPTLFRMMYVRAGKVHGRTYTAVGPQTAHELAQRWCEQSERWLPSERMKLLTTNFAHANKLPRGVTC